MSGSETKPNALTERGIDGCIDWFQSGEWADGDTTPATNGFRVGTILDAVDEHEPELRAFLSLLDEDRSNTIYLTVLKQATTGAGVLAASGLCYDDVEAATGVCRNWAMQKVGDLRERGLFETPGSPAEVCPASTDMGILLTLLVELLCPSFVASFHGHDDDGEEARVEEPTRSPISPRDAWLATVGPPGDGEASVG